MNLYKETKEKLEEIGFTWESVKYISVLDTDYPRKDSKLYKIKVDDFIHFAEHFDYDDGYGGAEVNTSLRIVFYGGSFLERGEYDGSEWWEYKKLREPIEVYEGDVKKILSRKTIIYGDVPDVEGIY